MDERGQFVITVEVEADETFDQMVSVVAANAETKRGDNPKSNALTPVGQLVVALFPDGTDIPEDRATLRYQLLTATAGTLKLA